MHPDAIRELFVRAIDAAAAGDTRYIAEAELPDAGWLQVTWDAINMSYPSTQDPAEILARIDVPQYVGVESWKPGEYVTFAHGADDLDRLAAFVADVLGAIA